MARRLLERCAMRNHIFVSTLLAATVIAGTANAQTSSLSRRMDGFAGKDELSAQLGFQASLGGGTPNGFKLYIDYSHRLPPLVCWRSWGWRAAARIATTTSAIRTTAAPGEKTTATRSAFSRA